LNRALLYRLSDDVTADERQVFRGVLAGVFVLIQDVPDGDDAAGRRGRTVTGRTEYRVRYDQRNRDRYLRTNLLDRRVDDQRNGHKEGKQQQVRTHALHFATTV
jgi:hypothetical protein